MAKTVTSKKQKKSGTKFLKEYEPLKSKELRNPAIVAEALVDCLTSGDLGAFREVLVAHILGSNKVELAKKAGIGRRTLYDLMDPKKEFNPELSTLSAVIRAVAA